MTNSTIKTWRERIGAGEDFPMHVPSCVERAMMNEIAELRAAVSVVTTATSAQPEPTIAFPGIAAFDVLVERSRQQHTEGWTPAHDDKYEMHELSLAAACYLLAGDGPHSGPPETWPWEQFWWKPSDDRRNMVKAAALILADIERLDRAGSKSQ